MAKQKSIPAPMIEKELNLAQDIQGVIHAINQENNLLILQRARDKEMQAGKRAIIIQALVKKAEGLKDQGPGSDSPEDPFATELEWEAFDPTKSKSNFEHDQGAGSEAKQNLTEEQRLLGELKIEANKHRIRDIQVLTTPTVKHKNGYIEYVWGSITPQQQQSKDKDGKVTIPFKGNKVVLKICPNCGKPNSIEQSMFSECVRCNFNIVQKLVMPNIDRFKQDIPEFEYETAE